VVLTSLALTVFTAALPAPPPASALFVPGEGESRYFKDFFEKGEALFTQQDFGAAISNFRLADRERVTPEVAYDLAKCHEKLGDLAYTVFYYRLYLRRAPSAPDTLEVASRVGTTLAKMEADGKGFLELEAARGNNVTVNGRNFPEGQVAVFLPPGDYEVAADFAAGRKKMRVQVRLGKTTTVSFEPLAPPLVPLTSALTEAIVSGGTAEASGQGPSPLRVGSYLVAGAGVAALVAASIFGAMSSQDAGKRSDKTLTLSQAQGFARSANAKGVTANVLFGVGGAAVAGGVLMFVFSIPDGAKPAAAVARP
jgi:hypothetical protein